MEHQARNVVWAVSKSQHQRLRILRVLEKQGMEGALQLVKGVKAIYDEYYVDPLQEPLQNSFNVEHAETRKRQCLEQLVAMDKDAFGAALKRTGGNIWEYSVMPWNSTPKIIFHRRSC